MIPRIVPLGFALLSIALLGTIRLELSWPDEAAGSADAAPIPTAMPVKVSAPEPPVVDAPELVRSLLARPLFSPGRRPPADAVATPKGEPLPRLTGIVVSPAGRYALFQPGANLRTRVLVAGEAIGGWTVRDVAADAITLAQGSQSLVLRPAFEAAPVPPPPPPVPPKPRWEAAADKGLLRARWSNPQLQPRQRRKQPNRRRRCGRAAADACRARQRQRPRLAPGHPRCATTVTTPGSSATQTASDQPAPANGQRRSKSRAGMIRAR
ncbi:MAG: hypothetical protein JO264_00215 [Acidisphaera sp.]|nr:hypothetical protein [Acidisphaera sp.]